MSRASVEVIGQDGNLGVVGPLGNMTWASFGAASKAKDLADQEPIVISSPSDAEELLGAGPLRDMLALSLTGVGTDVVVFPMKRSAGGTIIGAGTAVESGAMSVTVSAASWGYGGQEVIVRCVTGGAIAVAEFALIVNGKMLPKWKPGAAASAPVPDASAGDLNEGVPDAAKLALAFAFTGSLTAYVAGEEVKFQYSEPGIAQTAIGNVVNALAAHDLNWRVCLPSGWLTGAAWAAFDTAVRLLPSQGKYVRGIVQLAGPKHISGATTEATTAAWHTAIMNAYAGNTPTNAPARADNPRTGAHTNWQKVYDPIQGRERILPATYALSAAIAARNPWQPPEATKHGPQITDPVTRVKLLDVLDIHPQDFSVPQINAQDNIYLCTSTKYSGRKGIWPTHVRLFGVYPQDSVTGTDFIGIERGLVMDEACTRVYNALFNMLNDDIDTAPDGRMSESARAQWQGRVNGAIASLLQDRAITSGEAIVIDKSPGILQTNTVVVRLRIVPRGKAEKIEATVAFSRGIAVSEEVAAEAA